MTHQQILKKAIKKSIAGGYNTPGPLRQASKWSIHWLSEREIDKGIILANDTYSVIYSHDFAKALWGDYGPMGKPVISGVKDKLQQTPYWKIQLQNMVIAEDPIKYLGENL